MKVVIDFEPSIHSFNSYIECTIMEHISKVSKAVFKAYPFEYIFMYKQETDPLQISFNLNQEIKSLDSKVVNQWQSIMYNTFDKVDIDNLKHFGDAIESFMSLHYKDEDYTIVVDKRMCVGITLTKDLE